MRTVALLLLALAGTARADADAERVEPVRELTAGLFFAAHGGRIGGVPETGIGATAEVAYGAGRAQYFAEAGAASITIGRPTAIEDGFRIRGALGARWLARSLEIDREGAVELLLEATAGAHRYWWDHGGTLARPEIALGWGLQVRKYRRPHISARFSMRVFWAPAPDATLTAARCTTECAAPASPASGGILMFIGGAL